MEKLGIANQDLRQELSEELTKLLESRTQLTKTAGDYSETAKKLDAQIEAIKSTLATLSDS